MSGSTGLTAIDLTRRYGDTLALDHASLTIRPGEVHGLMGHNGAGKSTLLKMLTGADRPDSGRITVDGHIVSLTRPSDAHDAGIVGVYQELSLINNLTVAENLFLGHEKVRGAALDRRSMRDTANELLERYAIEADADSVVGTLPVASRQMIEVASAIRRRARYLLLDEPTTALGPKQVEQLFDRLRAIALADDVGIVLVDHRLDEVYAVAQRITAMTDGRVVLSGAVGEIPRPELEKALIGDRNPDAVPAARRERSAAARHGQIVLSCRELRTERLKGVDLEVRAGEVLGLYGLVGSGRTRTLRAIFGLERVQSGVLELAGSGYVPGSPSGAIRRRIAFISEERKHDGFIPGFTPAENVELPVLERFARFGVLHRRSLHQASAKALVSVNIRGDVTRPIELLSGGNQQKVLLTKALIQEPEILLLDEPTKGIDIGAKAEISTMIRNLAQNAGMAVVVATSDEEELLELADKVQIMHQGRTVGKPLPANGLSTVELRRLALG